MKHEQAQRLISKLQQYGMREDKMKQYQIFLSELLNSYSFTDKNKKQKPDYRIADTPIEWPHNFQGKKFVKGAGEYIEGKAPGMERPLWHGIGGSPAGEFIADLSYRIADPIRFITRQKKIYDKFLRQKKREEAIANKANKKA